MGVKERQRASFMRMVDAETVRVKTEMSLDEIINRVVGLVDDKKIKPPYSGACMEMVARHRKEKWLSDAQHAYLARSVAFAICAARPRIT